MISDNYIEIECKFIARTADKMCHLLSVGGEVTPLMKTASGILSMKKAMMPVN
jgi:hypothetical protein